MDKNIILFGLLALLIIACGNVANDDGPSDNNSDDENTDMSDVVTETCEVSNLVLSQDFDQYTNSELYTIPMGDRDFGTIRARTSGEIRGLGSKWPHKTRVMNGVLRAEYLKDIASGRYGGFLFDKEFEDAEEAMMEYRVKFDKDFIWKYGGKLPGLGGSALDYIPAGCTQDIGSINNGFSCRLMWRQSGEGRPVSLVVYTYFPDRDIEKCGEEIDIIKGIKKDKWYTIRQYIKLNTPGQRNGVLKMYIDGTLELERKNILYRKAGKVDVKINDAIFHTYRAGGKNDPRWISPTTDYTYFDDFKAWVNCSEKDT